MSTTWVFLGLLAGREFAMSMILDEVNKHRTSRNVSADAMKLMFGLAMLGHSGNNFADVL